MRRSVLVASLALSSGLAACVSEPRQAALPPQPQGIEGRWASVGEIKYNISLQNGQFNSYETATGALLARGTYSNIGPGQITIVFTSLTTSNQVAANCNQTGINMLTCTTSANQRLQFSRA